MQLIATSPHDRCRCALNVLADDTVISPDLKRLNKHSLMAASTIHKPCAFCRAPFGICHLHIVLSWRDGLTVSQFG